VRVPETSRTLTGDIEDALDSMRHGARGACCEDGLAWVGSPVSEVLPSVSTSLAGAVGAVGNAELHPAFSKSCGKARAFQRGFP
jgi:hypothetical protein